MQNQQSKNIMQNQQLKNPNLLTPKQNSLPRNAFDLSHHQYFTKPLGLLTPAFVQDVLPGDYIDIDVRI